LLLVALVVSVAAVRGQGAAGDMEKIQGTWKVVSVGGLDKELLKDAKVVITTDNFTIALAGNEQGRPYKLDPSVKPKAFDLLPPKNVKGLPSLGIYHLDGEDLKLCWDANGKVRPSVFTAKGKGGQDLRLMILKREKK